MKSIFTLEVFPSLLSNYYFPLDKFSSSHTEHVFTVEKKKPNLILICMSKCREGRSVAT